MRIHFFPFASLLIMLILSLGSKFSQAQAKQDDIIGTWQTDGDDYAFIEIYKQNNKYFGKIIHLKNPLENGKEKVDAKNPDKNKRNVPIKGLILLKDFEFDGDKEWINGKIYDPENGETYECNIWFSSDNNTLKLRGYVGISLFGRTTSWKRIKPFAK
jgi:uncharacterized protein (DUF2147 family)